MLLTYDLTLRSLLLILLLSLSISTLSFVVFIAEYSYIVNTFGQLSIISPQINSGHYTHDILLDTEV